MGILKLNLSEGNERSTRWSLIAGILIWFLHLNIIYGTASVSCKWGWFTAQLGWISALQLVESMITIVALLGMMLVIYMPWLQWRKFQKEKPAGNSQLLEQTENDRRPFVAFIAMLMNSILALFVLTAFVPIFVLSACGSG